MGGMIAKQPNGLLCRFSTNTDCVTDYNMTEDDYIDLCVARAVREAIKEARDVLNNYIRPFSEVVKRNKNYNMTIDKAILIFREMGYEPIKKDIATWNVKRNEQE